MMIPTAERLIQLGIQAVLIVISNNNHYSNSCHYRIRVKVRVLAQATATTTKSDRFLSIVLCAGLSSTGVVGENNANRWNCNRSRR